MKKLVLLIVLSSVVLCLNAQSKKIIFLNNGDKVEYKNFKGKINDIVYKSFDKSKKSLSYDEVYFIARKKMVYIPIQMPNRKALLTGPFTMNISQVNVNDSQTNGMVDAITKTDFKGAYTGGLVTSIFFPIGYVGTAIISSSSPDPGKLIPSDETYKSDQIYLDSYKKTVKKYKSHKTWEGAVIGTSIAVLIIAVAGAL